MSLLPSYSRKERDGQVLLDEVLRNQRVAPYTKESFKSFLEAEYAEENLEFYDKVDEYRETASDDGKESVDDVLTVKAEEVTERFIAPNSPLEVNISGPMRKEILKNVTEKKIGPALFDEAQVEVFSMLNTGPFERFLKSAVSENISKEHANWRKRVGIFSLCVGVLLEVAIFCLQIFSGVEVLESRYWRLLGFPFFFIGISYFQSGKRCVCSALAVQGVYMKKRDHKTWWEIYLGIKGKNKNNDRNSTKQLGEELDYVIQDPYAKEQLRKLGVRYFYESIFFSVLTTVIVCLLPPGQDIYPF